MAVTPQREPGQHRLEAANPDRVKFQRGKKVSMRDRIKRRRKGKKR